MLQSAERPNTRETAVDGAQALTLRLLSSNGKAGAQEFQLAKARSVIGRRKHNDLVLQDQTVSGEHAAICRDEAVFIIEDLDSSNGTVVNGNAITRSSLAHGDIVELGIYRFQVFLSGQQDTSKDGLQQGLLQYLTGSMRGIKQRLEKPLTKISVDGEVAVIARRKTGFFISHLEGAKKPFINGRFVGHRAVALRHGDEIELSGCRMRFERL